MRVFLVRCMSVCRGSNEFGQLGVGPSGVATVGSTHQLTPLLVSSLRTQGHSIVDVVCGERHTHVLTRAGSVLSFGSGEEHMMGVMDNVDQFRPVCVQLTGPAVSIATGSTASFAVLESGDVYGWSVVDKREYKQRNKPYSGGTQSEQSSHDCLLAGRCCCACCACVW